MTTCARTDDRSNIPPGDWCLSRNRLVWFVLIVAFGYGAWSSTPSPDVLDSGELAAAAWGLGGSHAPGQPLHAIVAHALCLLPVGNIPYRIALLSVLCSVVGIALIAQLTWMLCEAFARETPITIRYAAAAAAVVGAITTPALVGSSTRIEVYSFAFTLTLASMVSSLHAVRAKTFAGLGVSAICTGLCAAVHPPHAAIAGVALIAGWLGRPSRISLPFVGFCVALVALGTATYAYLPVRAYAGATMWGEPTRWSGFWDYVRGHAYQHNLGAKASIFTQLWDVLTYCIQTIDAPAVAGAVLFCGAAFIRFKKDRMRMRMLGFLSLVLGAAFAAGCLQPIFAHNPDNVAYLGAFSALVFATGASGWVMIASIITQTRGAIAAALLLAAIAFNVDRLGHAHESARRNDAALETLGTLIADAVPPRGLAVVRTDFFGAFWMQARAIELARPDVAVFIPGLATSSWHWKSLAHHPAYTGQPVRGKSETIRQSYVAGAFEAAAARVPIVSEALEPSASRLFESPPSHLGPYLVYSNVSASAARSHDQVVARMLAETAQSPDDMAAAVIRGFALLRARHFASRAQPSRAADILRTVMADLPRNERSLLRDVPTRLAHPPAPVIQDPEALLPTQEDVVREAAAFLDAFGATERARSLLQAQVVRGDTRGMLQLAWIEARAGRLGRAQALVDMFEETAPDLTHEAATLRQFF